MKPIFVKIPEDFDAEAFAVRITNLPNFSTEFHFHDECQMVYVVESEGKRIIGDSIEIFSSDELLLLGSGIPHVWHNDEHYFDDSFTEIQARSIAIFFNPEKLVERLSHFTPVNKLESILKKAKRGMKFSGKTKEQFKVFMLNIIKQEGFEKLMTFIKILELLTQTSEYSLLASEGYINTYQTKDNERIDKVFKFVFSNFTKEVDLDEAARLVNMNKQAFCRYFKSRTQKTFVNFVNEVRVGHACRLLSAGERHISRVSFACGFNSMSNFNRFFKEIKGVTPKEYLKMMAV